MPRYTWPPHDFECPYQHNCPYLSGLSTKWVYSEYRRAGDMYQEHMRIIGRFRDGIDERDKQIRALKRENAELKAKYQALHQRQFKVNRRKKDEPPAVAPDTPVEDAPKKRGAPVGHPG